MKKNKKILTKFIKESLLFERHFFDNEEILCEEILKEVSLKNQLFPILMSIVPLVPGCSIKDIKNGNVKPEVVAVAKFINDKIPEKHHKPVVAQIAKKNCSWNVTSKIIDSYNAETGETNYHSEQEWKETCKKVPVAEKIVNIMTSPKAMEKVSEKNADGSPNVFQQNIVLPQLEKDQKDGICKIIDGEVFYTPFCHTNIEQVDSIDLTDILEPGEKPFPQDLNEEDARDLEDFLSTIEELIKSSEEDFSVGHSGYAFASHWRQRRKDTVKRIKNTPVYSGLDINKIDKLHNDWTKSKSNQIEINNYINGEATDSFIDGIMKQEMDQKKSDAMSSYIGLKK